MFYVHSCYECSFIGSLLIQCKKITSYLVFDEDLMEIDVRSASEVAGAAILDKLASMPCENCLLSSSLNISSSNPGIDV